jgi:hypothetical protein
LKFNAARQKTAPKRLPFNAGPELNMSWQACLEESTGDYYYWNEKTGEVQWTKPAGVTAEELDEVCVYPATETLLFETIDEHDSDDELPPPLSHSHTLTPEIIPVEVMPTAELQRVDSVPLVALEPVERFNPVSIAGSDEWASDAGNDADDEGSRRGSWVCPLDRDTSEKARVKDAVNTSARDKVQRWIEAVLDRDLGLDLGPAVQDGMVLCDFINSIRPGTVKKVHDVQPEEDGAFVSAANIFKAQENVAAFTKGCIKIGVPRSSVFDTLDIIECRDLNAFLHCVTMLGRIVSTFKDYTGPQLLSKNEQIEAMKLSFKFASSNKTSSKNVPSMFRRSQMHTPPMA